MTPFLLMGRRFFVCLGRIENGHLRLWKWPPNFTSELGRPRAVAGALAYAEKFFPRIAETFFKMPSATSGLFIEYTCTFVMPFAYRSIIWSAA